MEKQTLQIMLIDNDKYVRESLSTFFDGGKLKFLIFKSAAEGLNSLKYQNIDVVISDYFLPDMNGLTFLKKVSVQNPGTARILMATIVNEDLKREMFQAGIDALLEKPLSIAAIDQTIYEINKKYSNRSKPEITNE